MIKNDILVKNRKIDALYEYDESLAVANLSFVFRVGGVVSEDKKGLAKLCASLMNEGTKSLDSEFNRLLDIKAIELNAMSGFETFSVNISCLKEHFDYALDMLKSLLEDINYDEKVLNRIKIQALGEIAGLKSEFDYIAGKKLMEILYPNSKLGYDYHGDEMSISSITLDDINGFLSEALSIENLYLVLSGDVKFDGEKLAKCVENLNLGSKKELSFFQISRDKKCIKQLEKTEQAYIYFGAPFYVDMSQNYLARVAAFILGAGGFGSRLMEEIRVKRGLAYSVYARHEISLSNSRIWGYLQTKNENMDKALALVSEEFNKFVREGVSEDELKSAKKFLLGSMPLKKETMIQRVSLSQSEYYLGLDFGYFDNELQKIEALTLDELNKFIASHCEILELSYAVVHGDI